MKRLTLLTNPDECNLHCPLCFLKQRAGVSRYGEMPLERALTAIEKYGAERDAQGRRLLREVVPSTMGEPLLYSGFGELLQYCVKVGIKVNLTTNGTFPGAWKQESEMERLLVACSDIKVSTLSCEMGGMESGLWLENVEGLLASRLRLIKAGLRTVSTVSLQVTVHRENLDRLEEILRWAESAGVQRIKWNPVVFLPEAPLDLRNRFGVDEKNLEDLAQEFVAGRLRSSKLENAGSLFFERSAGLCPVGGRCDDCPFTDEVWVWPDGHEDHCPNPARRWR